MLLVTVLLHLSLCFGIRYRFALATSTLSVSISTYDVIIPAS